MKYDGGEDSGQGTKASAFECVKTNQRLAAEIQRWTAHLSKAWRRIRNGFRNKTKPRKNETKSVLDYTHPHITEDRQGWRKLTILK